MASIPLFCLLLCFAHFSVLLSQPLFLPLTHTLAPTQFTTTQHLLKSTSARSAARFHHHHHHPHTHHRKTNQVSLPLSPGSDYTLSFTINSSPPQPVSLYMDTGSDLVWCPCSPFECILCEGKPNSTFPPPKIPKSAAVPCDSKSCSAVHSALPSSDLCAISRCPLDSVEISECSSFNCPLFYYAYADGSFIAKLYSHSISLPMSSPPLILSNFTFGCSNSALGEPIGVAGFGRGLLSLPAQLASHSPHLATQFSYCLVSHSFDQDRVRRPSPLILGPYDQKHRQIGDAGLVEYVYTTMLDNPKHPYFYSIGLAGVSIGKRVIPAPEVLKSVDENGNGGIVVDSGTTFTMLPSGFYNSLVAEFDRRVGRVHERAGRVEEETGLGPCYYYEKVIDVPGVTLYFAGNNNKSSSSVALPRRNYFYEFVDGGDGAGRKRKKVGCWMLMNGGDEKEMSDGPGGVLGNYQQQGFEVVYDLEKHRVGFARRQCALLWESLNQG